MGIGIAVLLAALGFAGHDQQISFGTALWFVLVAGAVAAGGWALWTGRRWGRGIAVFANLLLLPVCWYMAVGSHRPELGIPVGIVAVLALALLFSPAAVRWAAGVDDQPASSDSAGPDTR